jgi:hypothetical protein
MAYLIGVALAVGVSVFARAVGLDRDRAFYPTTLVVIAMLYDLFAVMGGSNQALGLEVLVGVGFVASAVLGFRSNLWWAAGGLFMHGVFDFFHGRLFSNPGVPAWWPAFCGAYDVTAALILAGLLGASKLQPEPSPPPS